MGDEMGGIFISGDFGKSWFEVSMAQGKQFSSVSMNALGDRIIAGETYGNLWLSADYGATWKEKTIGSKAFWSTITSNEEGDHIAAIATYLPDDDEETGVSQIWGSSDYGETWTRIDTNISGSNAIYFSSIKSNFKGNVLAATVYGGNIWTSSDYGSTWTETEKSGTPQYWFDVSLSQDGEHLAAVTGLDDNPSTIWISSDSAVTWKNIPLPAGISGLMGIASNNDGNLLTLYAFSGPYEWTVLVYISSDYGESWDHVFST